MGLEVVQDAVGEVVNAHLFYLGKRDIDLAVRTHLLDIGFQTVSDIDILVDLVLVNLPPMSVVDDDTITQVTALHHQYLNALTVIVIGIGLVKEFGELGTGNDALAGRVKINAHNVAASCLHVHALLTERNQQILGNQSPIQESAHLIHRFDAHERKIAHHGFWLFGRRYRAVLAVVIHKHTNGVAHLHVGCEVSLG